MPRKTARKTTSPRPRKSNEYSKNWVKWVVIYFLLGSLVYLSVYSLFFQKGQYTDFKENSIQQVP